MIMYKVKILTVQQNLLKVIIKIYLELSQNISPATIITIMKPSIIPCKNSHLVVQNAESQSPFSLLELDILDLQLPHGQRRSYHLLCHIILCRGCCVHLWLFSYQYTAQVYLLLQRKRPKSLYNSVPSPLLLPTHRLLPSSCVSGSGFWQ